MPSPRALCRTAIALLALLALLAACGGAGLDAGVTTPGAPGGRDTTGAPAQNAVAVRDDLFAPSVMTVLPGSTVTWTWSAIHTHDVTFDDGPTSGLLTNAAYQRTFTVPGTYRYHCTLHGPAMSGTVVVQ